MRAETILVYGIIGLVVYQALAKNLASGVTVIPTDEPLRIVPEPADLARTIPSLRTDSTPPFFPVPPGAVVNGLGDAWPGVTSGRLYMPTPAFPAGRRLMYPLPHRRVKVRPRWTR